MNEALTNTFKGGDLFVNGFYVGSIETVDWVSGIIPHPIPGKGFIVQSHQLHIMCFKEGEEKLND